MITTKKAIQQNIQENAGVLFPPLFLEAKVDIALLDQRVCSGRYLGLMTGPFHGTVGVKLSLILDKLADSAHWSPCVNRIQSPGSGPCAQNAVGALGARCH